MMIKNLLRVLKGSKKLTDTPRFTATVVITEAPTKKRMKNGKIFLKSTFSEPFSARLVRWNAKNSVMGMIASVRAVSYTHLDVYKRQQLSCQDIYTEPLEQSGHNGADYVLVVSDETADSMKPYYSLLAAQISDPVPDDLQKDLLALSGIDAYQFDAAYPEYADRGVGTDTIYSDDSPIYVKENSTRDMKFLISAIIFPLFYIGLVFVCVAMTILAVQQISDASKYRYRYGVLRKLGLREKEICAVLRKQLFVYYLCPFVVSSLTVSYTHLFRGGFRRGGGACHGAEPGPGL